MPLDDNKGGNGRNNGGPWGEAPGGGGNGPRRGGGGNTPSLEDILNRSRDSFGGGLPGGRALFGLGAVALIGLWLFQSVYTIAPEEIGVELVFGKPKIEQSGEGLHFIFWPVETVERAASPSACLTT